MCLITSCYSQKVVGRLASYKGIPLLTGLGDVISGQRSTYSTLIRASYDLWDKARALLAFLSHFHWYNFGLIYRFGDVYYSTLADELIALSNKPEYSDFVCTCKRSYIRDSNKTILTDLEKIIDDMTQCARSESYSLQSPLNVTINDIMSITHSHFAIYDYFYDFLFLFLSHCDHWWRERGADNDVNRTF